MDRRKRDPLCNLCSARGRAHLDSSEGQAADARFESLARCDSKVYFSDMIYDGMLDEPEDGDALLET